MAASKGGRRDAPADLCLHRGRRTPTDAACYLGCRPALLPTGEHRTSLIDRTLSSGLASAGGEIGGWRRRLALFSM